MPFLALLPMLLKGALDALSAAIRSPIGAAALAAGLTWLVVGHNERGACSARADALRLELQRAADAEHARREAAIVAYSDEAGHAFQYEAGHLFRSEAGQRSDLMSAAGVVRAQIDLDDVSRRGRGQACSSFAGAERRLRRLSPESSSR